MAYAPPDPKKVKALERKQREEREQAKQIESCYRQHRTGQARYAAWREREPLASLAAELGIDLTVRFV